MSGNTPVFRTSYYKADEKERKAALEKQITANAAAIKVCKEEKLNALRERLSKKLSEEEIKGLAAFGSQGLEEELESLGIENVYQIMQELKSVWDKADIVRAAGNQIREEIATFNQSVIPEAVLWKQDANGHFTFIVPPFEKNPTQQGTDRNLTQLLKYCDAKGISADIIFSVAEESPRAFIKRQHFVTYHYTTDADGKISQAKCYDSVRDMDNSGFTGILSKIANAFRWLVGAKPKRFFSVDQQETMQQSILENTSQNIEIQRHYSGVQKNDIDCGYWSAVISTKLAEKPDISEKELSEYLRESNTKKRMLKFKNNATEDKTIQTVGSQYQSGVNTDGSVLTPQQSIQDYAKINEHNLVRPDEIPKDKRTNVSGLMGILIDDLVVSKQIQTGVESQVFAANGGAVYSGSPPSLLPAAELAANADGPTLAANADDPTLAASRSNVASRSSKSALT